MFVVRGETFLTLERGPGRGEGVWYLPGGLVERGEDPLVAAVRETREETGLEVHGVRVLRVWTYATPEGHDTVHATFVGSAPAGDVVLSREHRAFAWMTAADYVAQWCSEELEAAMPAHAGWIRRISEPEGEWKGEQHDHRARERPAEVAGNRRGATPNTTRAVATPSIRRRTQSRHPRAAPHTSAVVPRSRPSTNALVHSTR
jgi:ADP-ribose pyrophosphatase YjhB (NUDIX family)